MIRSWLVLATISTFVLNHVGAIRAALVIEVPPVSAKATPGLVIYGSDTRRQIMVTEIGNAGEKRDVTHDVTYSTDEPGVIRVEHGMVIPLANGTTQLSVRTAAGAEARIPVSVEDFTASRTVDFANQVVPVFTKAGCNGGGCHGKAAGQNGFRLSLLGFEPLEDYDHLVTESRGRRLFPAAPERSLLLLKGTAELPHGGGKRLETDSDDYRLLVRWIEQGMPPANPSAPTVQSISVYPPSRSMGLGGAQQLAVLAKYSDGHIEDVTRGALFESNDKEMARVDANGFVQLLNQPGDVTIMIRYQSKVGVFRATIPLGAPIAQIPPSRNFIDDLVFKKLRALGMPPSEVCDDNTFLRRVTVDIAGRLPTSAELDNFLADRSADKRSGAIDRLLASTDYADYFANKWAALLRNKRKDAKYTNGNFAFYDWVRDSLMENKPFNSFVRELLTAAGDIVENPPVAWYRQVRESTAELEDSAQLFLGMRLQCAQCHHHPYEKWSQQDYYRFAAFFSRVGRKPGRESGEEVVFHRRGNAEATNKKTKQPERPAGLGAPLVQIAPDDDPRAVLADWMTSEKNPYFAKALVNRYWKHFLNRALVEPEDDMRETNPPANPELLQALAEAFVKSGYDLKALVRTITTSTTYQLSALPNEYNRADKQNFSHYYPKRLSAEVLYDSVDAITSTPSEFAGLPSGTRAIQLPDNSYNATTYFFTVFGRPESSSACECERSQDASLAQSLHLLNAKGIQEKLANDKGLAAALASDQSRPDQAKINDLYHLAYGREASAQELEIALKHLASKAADPKAKRAAFEDILWALLNSKEFLFNH